MLCVVVVLIVWCLVEQVGGRAEDAGEAKVRRSIRNEVWQVRTPSLDGKLSVRLCCAAHVLACVTAWNVSTHTHTRRKSCSTERCGARLGNQALNPKLKAVELSWEIMLNWKLCSSNGVAASLL